MLAHFNKAYKYLTANSDVEVKADNVVHVDFGAIAMSMGQSVAQLAA